MLCDIRDMLGGLYKYTDSLLHNRVDSVKIRDKIYVFLIHVQLDVHCILYFFHH
jgi:hypothetical protein